MLRVIEMMSSLFHTKHEPKKVSNEQRKKLTGLGHTQGDLSETYSGKPLLEAGNPVPDHH